MSLLEHYGSPALMRALGWTLLHSVWQGALVALTAATLLMLLHRHAAALRYRVAAAAMLLLLVLSGLTFGYYYASFRSAGSGMSSETGATVWPATAPADVAPLVEGSVVSADGTTVTEDLAPMEEPGRVQQLVQTGKIYLERNMPFLVVAWLLGMLGMTLRFLGGLAYVQRLRRYRVAALPAEWQTRLNALAARTNLRRPVQILASGLVPGPLVIGWLKPVILLPMSAASGLSGIELEAILAHELAHVMRRDYLFNLLQSVAEILFFYHPAVWFLSGCLRTERENCCDDIATELCGDSLVLAQALASLAALQHTQSTFTPRLAMAAAGQPGSLLGRVRRLVQHRAAAPTFSDGFWAACVVLLSVGLLTVTTVLSLSAASFSSPAATATGNASTETDAEPSIEETTENIATEAPDHSGYEPADNQLLDDTVVVYAQTNPKLLTKSGKAKLNEIKGLTVVVKDESGNISEVYVDGKKVPAAELPAYRTALAKTKQAKRTPKAQPTDREARMQQLSLRMASAALDGASPSGTDAQELSRLALEIAGEAMRQEAEHPDATAETIQKSFETAEQTLVEQLNNKSLSNDSRQELKEALQELRQEHADQLQELQEERRQAAEDQEQDRRDEEQNRRDEDQARRDTDQARRDSEQAKRDVEQARRDKEQAAWHKALEPELIKDGLIQTTDSYSFTLSTKSLTANGKKQSDGLRDKYLKLYQNSTGRTLSATGSVNMHKQSNSNSSVAYNNMPPAPPAPATPMAPALPRVPRPAAAPRAPRAPAVPQAPEVDSDQIREALQQDGLLDKGEKSFSLQLNKSGLIVNGKKQSEALTAKYLKLLGGTNSKTSKTSINITVSE